jgi:hypothetical protein
MECNLRFEVLTAMLLKVQVFRDVTLCHRASGSDVLKLLCRGCLTLKIEEVPCFKTSGTIGPATQCHISEDLTLHGMQWFEFHHEGKHVLWMEPFCHTCMVCCYCDLVCLVVGRLNSSIFICAEMKCCLCICNKG